MSNFNREIISPITFVNNVPTRDSDLNFSLTFPFINRLSNQYMTNWDDIEKSFTIRETSAMRDIIRKFTVINCLDIMNSSLLKFAEENFNNDFESVKKFNEQNRNLVTNLEYLDFPTIYSESNNLDILKSICTALFDQIYSNLCYWFDLYIQQMVTIHLSDLTNYDLYVNLFNKTFESIPTKIPDIQNRYVFCLSILRELSVPYLVNIRKALNLLLDSVLNMIYLHSQAFGNNIKQIEELNSILENNIIDQ